MSQYYISSTPPYTGPTRTIATQTGASVVLNIPRKNEKWRTKTKQTFDSIGRFCYNKSENTYCYRTARNWLILLAFYAVFFGVLFGGFFALLFFIVGIISQTTQAGPQFQKSDLWSYTSPAITSFPRLPALTVPIIWYAKKGKPNEKNIFPETYINSIEKFLKPLDVTNARRYVDCEVSVPRDGEYCRFTKNDLGPCGIPGFGYTDDKPCVYLKLNQVEGWKPSRKRVKIFQARANVTQDTTDMISVKCNGVTSFDAEHMGKIQFYPIAGFKEHFFPYDGSADYVRPLIGIQFENLERGIVVGVKCKVTDMENMKNPKLHSVVFYLYIDK